MGFLDTMRAIVSPTSWGEELARMGIPASSERLVNNVTTARDNLERQDIARIVSNITTGQSAQNGLTTANAAERIAGGMVLDNLASAFNTVAGASAPMVGGLGLGSIISVGAGGGAILQDYKAVIELVGGQKDNPGMVHRQFTAGGRTIDMWVDATSSPPTILDSLDRMDADDVRAMKSDYYSNREFEMRRQQIISEAVDANHKYIAQHGEDGFKRRMEALESGIGGLYVQRELDRAVARQKSASLDSQTPEAEVKTAAAPAAPAVPA